MSFAPINQIHQCLHAYHVPSHDRTQVVESYHYCSHTSPDMFQCLIYDSDSPKARLIGIEYVISGDLFETLPMEERAYWHSHKHEVASGLLCPIAISGAMGTAAQAASHTPGIKSAGGGLPDELEKGPLMELYKTYGKTIHTWHPTSSKLPLGPPVLMTSTTSSHPGPRSNASLLQSRKDDMGIDTAAKEEYRKSYLDQGFQVAKGADAWEEKGKAVVFEAREVEYKQEDGSMSKTS